MDLYLMRDIELQLRQAAEEIRRKNHNGWGNACEQAADALANALDDLAAERARAEREEQAHTRTIEQRDALEEQIEAVYRALGGDGEWCAKLPPEEPPDSGDLGADALALAKAATLAIAQHACSDLAMQTALAHTRAANTALRADRDRLQRELEAERARADAAVAEAAEHKMFREESARRLAQCRVDRDRLRAAGRALLACPHIAERDTDPDWVDAETEAAVAEMRDALEGEP